MFPPLVGHQYDHSLELGHFLDATELGVPVVHVKALAGECIRLHALVVPGADRVKVGPISELLELLRGLVDAEDLFDAVEVVTDIVPVLAHTKCPIDLVLEAELHFDLLSITYI